MEYVNPEIIKQRQQALTKAMLPKLDTNSIYLYVAVAVTVFTIVSLTRKKKK